MNRRPLPTPEGRMVSLYEVSQRLNITEKSLGRWRKGGPKRRPAPVAYIRSGGAQIRIWFVETELVEWMKEYRRDMWAKWKWQQQILAS